jgi:hypothetical protein
LRARVEADLRRDEEVYGLGEQHVVARHTRQQQSYGLVGEEEHSDGGEVGRVREAEERGGHLRVRVRVSGRVREAEERGGHLRVCQVAWCGVVWYGMVWYGMVWE